MQEAGLLNKWIANWMPMKDQCWGAGAINRAADNHKVNLHDMQGIFFVLIFGNFFWRVFNLFVIYLLILFFLIFVF